jgi:hypothetical protein
MLGPKNLATLVGRSEGLHFRRIVANFANTSKLVHSEQSLQAARKIGHTLEEKFRAKAAAIKLKKFKKNKATQGDQGPML